MLWFPEHGACLVFLIALSHEISKRVPLLQIIALAGECSHIFAGQW